jgi:phage baseplate assembly protein W
MARYLDFFTSFLPHPDTGQLLFKSDERAINQSIRNLLLTNRGERPFENNVGSNVRALLFELFDDQTESLAHDYVVETLKQEPRAAINTVLIKADETNNALIVHIEYVYGPLATPVTLNVTLSRVR